MEKESLIKNLIKKLRGAGSEEERQHWDEQLRRTGAAEEAEAYEAVWRLAGRYRSDYQPDAKHGFKTLRQRMNRARRRQRRLFLATAVAASLALLFGLWWWPALQNQQPAQPAAVVLQANETPRTEQLPDGTTIQLNRRSRLTYQPSSDGTPQGPLHLEGEAFFEVVPQNTNQFQVRTEHADVAVLGTAFNLRAFPGEQATELEVEEGAVSFRERLSGKEVVVRGGQRGLLIDGYLQLQDEAPFLGSRAWRNATLSFRETPLEEVVQTLDRYYDLQLELDLSNAASCAFTSPPFTPDEVEDILRSMALIYGAELVKEGEQHYVLVGGSCVRTE